LEKGVSGLLLAKTDERELVTETLLRNAVFSPCDPEAVSLLGQLAHVRTSPRKTVIVHENESFPYLGVVIQGVIGVTCTAKQGREMRLYEAATAQTFGEAAFFDGDITLGRISVLSKNATYALIPKEAVLSATQRDSALLLRLAGQEARRSRELTARLMSQAVESIISRVAGTLLPFAMEGEGLLPVDPALLAISQIDIAASAGTVKEVAARAIADLEKAGALRRERGHVRYLNRAKLLAISE
jgi:CRP-like cAMP-binding protein